MLNYTEPHSLAYMHDVKQVGLLYFVKRNQNETNPKRNEPKRNESKRK